MKTILKIVAVPVAAAVMMLAAPSTSRAEHYERGHRGGDGATAAAIVAGIATVGIIAAIASQHDREYRPAYCAPPPPRYEPPQQWVPGHYEMRREQVCVPGYWTTVVERRHHGWGRRGCEERVWVPERYEWRATQVWVPGHYELACAD